MPLSFLHTADWHWGRFHWPVEDQADNLRQIWQLASEKKVDFVLVAGGVFYGETPAESVWLAALESLQNAPVPVVVMPGRRDPNCEGSIWKNAGFTVALAAISNLHLALSSRPISFAGATIFPFPLARFNAQTAFANGERGENPRIGLASLAPENLAKYAAAKAGFDYLALGGVGEFRPQDERSFFAGGAEIAWVQLAETPIVERLFLENAPNETPEIEADSPLERADFAETNWETLEAEILKILDAEFDLESLQDVSQAEKIAFWSAEPAARDAARHAFWRALQE